VFPKPFAHLLMNRAILISHTLRLPECVAAGSRKSKSQDLLPDPFVNHCPKRGHGKGAPLQRAQREGSNIRTKGRSAVPYLPLGGFQDAICKSCASLSMISSL